MMFEIAVKLFSSNGEQRQTQAQMKVDTGTHYSVLTTETIAQLGLPVQKHPLTREPVRLFLCVANGSGFNALVYGPLTLLIPVNVGGNQTEMRPVTADVIEGSRNILAMTQLEMAGAGLDVENQRLIQVPIEI